MKLFEVVEYTKHSENIEEFINEVITNTHVDKYAYAYHNMNDDSEHVHIMIQLKELYKNYDIDDIQTTFNLRSQQIQKAKAKGPKAYRIMCEYLIHKYDTTKEQIDPYHVIANFDYLKLIKDHREQERENEEFINDLVDLTKGIKTHRQMAIKYGRDFIKNFKAYESFIEILNKEESTEMTIYEEEIY